jgi:hypothetical protein
VTEPEQPSPKHPCALCSAHQAVGFPPTCPPEQAHFTHDQRICDACLATDFSRTRIPEIFQPLYRTDLNFGLRFGFLTGAIIITCYHQRGWLALFVMFGTTIVAGSCFTFLTRLIRLAYLARLTGQYVRENPGKARLKGERFYYLAQWGALTNHPAFARQMLEHSRRMGFVPSMAVPHRPIPI